MPGDGRSGTLGGPRPKGAPMFIWTLVALLAVVAAVVTWQRRRNR
jgi:hypothetical protein